MSDDSSNFLETIANTVQRIRDAKYYVKGTSLVEASQATSVNPIMLVDESLSGMQVLPELGGVVQNIFTSYYLTAASLMTNISGVKISKILGPLNPNRPVFESRSLGVDEDNLNLYASETMNLEGRFGLPLRKNYKAGAITHSFESAIDDNDSTDHSELSKVVYEYSPLSVGRVYDVQLGGENDDGELATANVKVSIRLLSYMAKTNYLVDLLTFKSHTDMALAERWFNYKIDKIGLVDLLFQRDLIAKHRNMMIRDKTGIYKEIVSRKNRGTLATILTGKPSFAAISNIALISKETSLSIEDAIDGQLSKFKTRNAAMESTGLMILGVIDASYERATFYMHSQQTPVTVPFKDFKVGSKSNNKLEDMLALMVSSNGATQRF